MNVGTSGTFVVQGSVTGKISGSYGGGGTTTLSFDPTNDFQPGEEIEVSLTTTLQSTGGFNPTNPYVFRFLAAAGTGPAQFLAARNFGTGSDNTWSIAFGDADGDGDLDVALANSSEQNAVYLNDGSGEFTAGTKNFGTGSDSTTSVGFGDVDGDGDVDVAAGNYGEQNVVYLNDGSGNFTAGTKNFGTGTDITYSVAFGDVDGDGDLDVATGNDGEQNVVYLNDGSGNFTAGTKNFGTGSDATLSIALGDVDGDGDLDAAVGNPSGQNVVYLNDGSGNFTAGTKNFGTGSDATFSTAFGDVDGDGDLDAATGNSSGRVGSKRSVAHHPLVASPPRLTSNRGHPLLSLVPLSNLSSSNHRLRRSGARNDGCGRNDECATVFSAENVGWVSDDLSVDTPRAYFRIRRVLQRRVTHHNFLAALKRRSFKQKKTILYVGKFPNFCGDSPHNFVGKVPTRFVGKFPTKVVPGALKHRSRYKGLKEQIPGME